MLRSYRSLILAVGLILAGVSQAPQSSAQSNKERATEKQNQAARSILADPTETTKPVEPAEYYQPCEQAQDKARSDLCAQWSAAKAAKEAANWAWWQLWLSGLGVLGLGVTLWFNFRALALAESESTETKNALAIAEQNANSARRAAQAANDANLLSREQMQRQLRPIVYVSHPHITYNHILGFDIIENTAQVIFYIKNYGKTPAYDVKFVGHVFIGGIWNAPIESKITESTIVYLADIPPDEVKSRDGYTVVGLSESHKDIVAGTRSVFAEGVVNYRDAFGDTYVTAFRFAATDTDYLNSKWADCPEGNYAS